MVGPTNQIHGGTHYLCERREYAFIVLREYLIIFQTFIMIKFVYSNFLTTKKMHMKLVGAGAQICTLGLKPYLLIWVRPRMSK